MRFSRRKGEKPMKLRFTPFIVFAVIAAVLAAVPADAQQMRLCAERDSIVAKLESKYQETRRSYGLQAPAGVFEVFASDTGTWTMLLTAPSGVTCILAAGEAWSDDKTAVIAKGDPV